MKYFPLRTHSHYSLQRSATKSADIVERLDELELDGCVLSDIATLSGAVNFFKTMKEKKKKAILGGEILLSEGPSTERAVSNRHLNNQLLIAKNLKGWRNLISLSSESNNPDRFYHKPRLDHVYLEDNIHGDLIGITGYLGSRLANMIMLDGKLIPDWEDIGLRELRYQKEVFGRDHTYVGIGFDSPQILADAIRDLAKKADIPCVALPNSYYCKREDVLDQRVLLCSQLNTTLAKVNYALDKDEDVGLKHFFQSDNFYMPSTDEMLRVYTEEELHNSLLIAAQCEDYDILHKPMLPDFPCPDNLTPDEYLRKLCRQGWLDKIKGKVDESQHANYADRMKEELSVLQGAGLSSYFLIVRDFLDYAYSLTQIRAPGRGSVCGSLAAYLLNLTQVDPIKYDLLFSRFYNKARAGSMPDVDSDIPVAIREKVINYIKDKYGHDKVAQMVTYQTMKGRSAIKGVFHAYGTMSFDEMNKITEFIPDEAKIADDLQEMREETGESSIIRWALENRPSKFKEWCSIGEDGNLTGDLAQYFEQAIRLEATKISQSRHASGLVVGTSNLSDICPMLIDKNKNKIIGFEMSDAEAIGLLKLDVLGLAMLDKMIGVRQILECGDIYSSQIHNEDD